MTDPAPDDVATVVERHVDLDAERRARREKQGPAPTVTIVGQTITLPRNMPAEVLDLIRSTGTGDYTAPVEAFRVLIGAEAYEQISAAAKTAGDPLEIDDVIFLLERALVMYEVKLPESGASPTS